MSYKVPQVKGLFCGSSLGEHGWRSGESTSHPPIWPRFDARTRVILGSSCRSCSERFFSGKSGLLF